MNQDYLRKVIKYAIQSRLKGFPASYRDIYGEYDDNIFKNNEEAALTHLDASEDIINEIFQSIDDWMEKSMSEEEMLKFFTLQVKTPS